MIKRIARIGCITITGVMLLVLVGLELWYWSLLPRELPRPSARPMPALVRRTLWVSEFRGGGEPRMRPAFPFIIGWFVGPPYGDRSLVAGLARFWGRPERSYKYMLHQAALGTWISRHWSAEQALDTFAAQVWIDGDHYGLEDGSSQFFDKPIGSLSVAELALLVGTVQSPRALNPRCHPERAASARERVLKRMRGAGLVGEREFATAASSPIVVQGQCTGDGPRRPTRS